MRAGGPQPKVRRMAALRILFIADPPHTLDPETDTTIALAAEATARGHHSDLCTPTDLSLEGAGLVVAASPIAGTSRHRSPAVALAARAIRSAASYDAIFMRKDPPFDTAYLTATLLLERVRGEALLVNDPRALRDANEKLFTLEFPQLIPATRVTCWPDEIESFMREQDGDVIVKPLDQCGGAGVFRLRTGDPNLHALLETATQLGSRHVMAQRYLPAVRRGDKRILLLDGEPVGALLRVPRADETRANIHAGGTAQATTLTEREREICTLVGRRLRDIGVVLAGIDVIGEHLTEINITSPTGFRQLEELDGVRLAARVVDWVERRVSRSTPAAAPARRDARTPPPRTSDRPATVAGP
jgi:glutathione synthase